MKEIILIIIGVLVLIMLAIGFYYLAPVKYSPLGTGSRVSFSTYFKLKKALDVGVIDVQQLR